MFTSEWAWSDSGNHGAYESLTELQKLMFDSRMLVK